MRAKVAYPITNKYMFGAIFSKVENVRPLLEEALRTPIREIRLVEPEHVLESSLMGHGVRMDVFADDEAGTVYDVEMQNANEHGLAQRSRYLLSSFDRDRLRRGASYKMLGETVVIFVCSFDPMGLGERRYVVQPTVLGHDAVYDDGTKRIFLNAQGASCDEHLTENTGSHRLAAFLSYVDGGDTMGEKWVEHLDDEVRSLNNDEGWRGTMLGIALDHMQDIYDARQEGIAEGREEGIAEGREEGIVEGREEGRKEASEQLAALATALVQANREGELAEAALDPKAMERLLAEFGLA